MTALARQSYRNFLEQVLRMDAMERRRNLAAATRTHLAGVRLAPNGYGAIIAWLSCAALLALWLQADLLAVIGLITGWFVLPLVAWQDRVRFDGQKLVRRGMPARLARLWQKQAGVLALDDIETIETTALRSLRYGGRVYYRYRCTVRGAGQSFVIVSGGASFRRLVRALLAQVPDVKLDARSRELRDHLVEPFMLEQTLRRLALASENLLHATDEGAAKNRTGRNALPALSRAADDATRAEGWARGQLLRRAANELYVLGRMSEAAEAFRRAWRILPHDASLLYEMGRFWHSQAGAWRDVRLWRRGQAALRLAARYGALDAALLSRIAESWLEYNEPRRAEKLLRGLAGDNLHGDTGDSAPTAFRAALGLAELGLRRGQGAHIRHHYGTAAACAPDAASLCLAQRENEYYSRLSDDAGYLQTELRRLNALDFAGQAHTWARRVTMGGLLLALLGPSLQADLGVAGWSLAAVGLPLWAVALMGQRFLARRRK